jgi:glycosyltransferase involved in cell wall biosynthesis
MSDSTIEDYRRHILVERTKAILIRTLFDRAIVAGRRAEKYITALGMPVSRVRQCYDVVDNQHFADVVTQLQRTSNAHAHGLQDGYFLYVGRLAPEKNVGALIDAFAIYRRAGGARSLVIVGDGPLSADLRHRANAEHLQEVIQFAGRKGYTQLAPYYAFAECLVLPSLREPWGLVVNEAMASGLPAIISRVCGCCDDLIVPGLTGFHFDPNSPRDLAELLLSYSRLGPEERCRMGLRAADKVRRFSLDQWAANVCDLAQAAST